ncbi:TPA: hypothetical protein DEP34_02275 [Candidatus Uhrbacteria bacterium]|uniref:Uncharacterized protein n=2 Tax=Candidatus Uhriibacteriota TaxID=1752732 RepID=A0A0G1Q5H1_9BACT|nr:MAG: hypothetical protein UX45_C0032G0006 [Candidatus Uhrbacteria bacterium GW2011_GWF2_46_218]KKU40209.1 MAG: hypothetical protein UX57_C0022G0008 [Candidatus Uhrbacteria bacterium GW2011_GWE2_46_68]HBK33943.1 hypothetical protein [Candidatus Uhrbacteria bacterium]HCB19189.1 hypothetical protein [Candidatus Uhrbacteria bacterium]
MSEHHTSPDHSRLESFAPHMLDIAARALDLPPHVEARKQTLVEEVLTLCKKHGFSHPNELAISPDNVKIPLSDLELLADLMSELEHIIKHRELPNREGKEDVDDREYTIELPKDAEGVHILDDHGRPVVSGFSEDGFIIDHTGEMQIIEDAEQIVWAASKKGPKLVIKIWEVGWQIRDLHPSSKEEKKVYDFVVLSPRYKIDHAFFTHEKGELKVHPMNTEGEVIGRSEGYEGARSLLTIGEHTYFVATEEKSSRTHVYDEQGRQVNKENYDGIDYLISFEGKLVLSVKKKDRSFFVYPDGTLLEDEPKHGFEGCVRIPKVFDGKIYFFIQVNQPSRQELWTLLDHTGENFVEDGGYFDSNLNPTDMRKVGEDMYFFTAHSNFLHRLSQNGEHRFWKALVFPILVGNKCIITEALEGVGVFGIADGRRHCYGIFDEMYFLQAIDHHRFYVIAKEREKIVKRVFTV